MTEVAKRIEQLRKLMAEQNIDAYVVPTADFHHRFQRILWNSCYCKG